MIMPEVNGLWRCQLRNADLFFFFFFLFFFEMIAYPNGWIVFFPYYLMFYHIFHVPFNRRAVKFKAFDLPEIPERMGLGVMK